MNRILVIVSTLIFTFNVLFLSAAEPPNLVWIIADDMSPDIGAYGALGVKTPNLDRLAAEGRIFRKAYASAPVCSSSRSAFILGCYQTTTGLHPHDVERPQPLPAPYIPLPKLLQQSGYYVTNAAAPGATRNGLAIQQGKTHYNFLHESKEVFDSDEWRNRKPGQPFFAQFQISEPHRPFPIPSQFDEEAVNAIDLPRNYPEHPLIRRDWYVYQRSVEIVDQRVGTILDQLDSEGVLNNTIVMFFADHGRPMPWGKQWLSIEGLRVPLMICGPGIEKMSIEDRVVSLIDLAPTALHLSNAVVPSWMEGAVILGGTFPEREFVFAARDRCGDADDRIRAIVCRDFLLVKNFHPNRSRLNWSSYKESSYPGLPLLRQFHTAGQLTQLQIAWLAPTARPVIELYDLKSDPRGLENNVDDPQYRDTVALLLQRLEDEFNGSHDRGHNGDPTSEPSLLEIQLDKRNDYTRVWNSRLGKPDPSDEERLSWWLKCYGL